MMKRLFRLMLVTALAICACNIIEDQTAPHGKMSFTASLRQEVKTVLVDGAKIFWEDGDRISVSGAQSPFVTSLTQASQVAVFRGEAETSDRYHAVYPFSCVESWSEDLVLVSLPQIQHARKDSFDPEANIIAASTEASSMTLQFRNVAGYVKFTVGSQSGDITSVTLSSNAQDALSGDFLLDCYTLETVPDTESYTSVSLVGDGVLEEGTYYVAMLPGIYSEGLTFTFEGPEGTAVKSISGPLTLEQGKVNSLGEISSLSWEQEKTYYVEVAQTFDDWSGEYLITYDDGSSVIVFDSWSDETYGQSATDLKSKLTVEGIPAEDGDSHKSVISKVGQYYSIYVTNVGYIGFTGSSNALHRQTAAPGVTDTKYLWVISWKDGGSIWLRNAANTSRRLQWNMNHPRFACYTGSQEELTLYRRTTVSGGVTVTPAPDPTPDPTPDPDTTPDPDPEIPVPVPGATGKYGWYELPVISYSSSGNYLIDTKDPDLYYAHHMCAGNEKGPGGKQARNYTVCFSAEHHCPVWVAAPRHKMYESGASRTDSYGKDPSIPADIQYSSRSTGGGCNKGHMLGSAERLSSTATNRQVFYYTNIAPQYGSTFNTGGGGWNNLEEWVDGQVCSDTLYVVIGAYFDQYTDPRGTSASPKTISFGGRNDVSCPTMFYYALLRTKKGDSGKSLSQCTSDEIKCAAFVRSHKTPKGIKVSSQEMMSVSDLEKLTGFTYFPNVPQAPKGTCVPSDWGL